MREYTYNDDIYVLHVNYTVYTCVDMDHSSIYVANRTSITFFVGLNNANLIGLVDGDTENS